MLWTSEVQMEIQSWERANERRMTAKCLLLLLVHCACDLQHLPCPFLMPCSSIAYYLHAFVFQKQECSRTRCKCSAWVNSKLLTITIHFCCHISATLTVLQASLVRSMCSRCLVSPSLDMPDGGAAASDTSAADRLQLVLANHTAMLDASQPGSGPEQHGLRPVRRKPSRAPTVDTAAAPYILHHKRLRSLAVEGYQMKDSLMLPEGRPRWVIISRAITEAVGLSYDDCISGRFCKGPNDPGFDQRMQTVIKACPLAPARW